MIYVRLMYVKHDFNFTTKCPMSFESFCFCIKMHYFFIIHNSIAELVSLVVTDVNKNYPENSQIPSPFIGLHSGIHYNTIFL